MPTNAAFLHQTGEHCKCKKRIKITLYHRIKMEK